MNKAMFFSKVVPSGKSFWLMLFSLICAFMMAGCASDDDLGEITGQYHSGYGYPMTTISISNAGNGYKMVCEFYDPENDVDEKWSGFFQLIPDDAITDANGAEIGSIHLSKDEVVFTATTQKPGKYKAYRNSKDISDLTRRKKQK